MITFHDQLSDDLAGVEDVLNAVSTGSQTVCAVVTSPFIGAMRQYIRIKDVSQAATKAFDTAEASCRAVGSKTIPGEAWKTLNSIGPTIFAALADPAFDTTVKRAKTLISLVDSSVPSTTPAKPVDIREGVGLNKIVPWLDRAIWVLRNKWVIPVTGASAIALLFGAGLGVGVWIGRR